MQCARRDEIRGNYSPVSSMMYRAAASSLMPSQSLESALYSKSTSTPSSTREPIHYVSVVGLRGIRDTDLAGPDPDRSPVNVDLSVRQLLSSQ